MWVAEMSPEPSPHLKPQDIRLQEDSVVNSKQDSGLGCYPHTSLAPLLLQLYPA